MIFGALSDWSSPCPTRDSLHDTLLEIRSMVLRKASQLPIFCMCQVFPCSLHSSKVDHTGSLRHGPHSKQQLIASVRSSLHNFFRVWLLAHIQIGLGQLLRIRGSSSSYRVATVAGSKPGIWLLSPKPDI